LLKHSAESKNIFINYQLPANLIVYADKNMLNTVVRNLISNAIKFTNEGGMIYIEADSDKSNLKVAVSDTGIGLKKSEISKLFRIESEFSRKGTNNEGGTGLGLILCKEFIEKHNGEIWVESEYRNGSTFHFSIPVNPDN
jgi:signal transduction histidine kinase